MQWHMELSFILCACGTQAATKKKVSKEEWERKLASVELRKDDLNQLVMNFLVTEVSAASPSARIALPARINTT